MRRLLSTVAALAAFTAVLPAGASTVRSWEDVSTQTALAALDSAPRALTAPLGGMVRLPIHPNAGAPAFITNFVTVGPGQTGVPCFSCVSGAQTKNNIGLTAPYNYVLSNEIAQYTISFTDITNTGNCTLSWAIASGKTKIDAFSYLLKSPAGGSSYVIAFNRNRPSYSGAAVLTGKVACTGSGSQSVTTTMYFQ